MDRPSPSWLEFIEADATGKGGRIADAIFDSFRSRKSDRCAIFIPEAQIQSFLDTSGIDAERLDPAENFKWQGVQTATKRRWKRIIIGDYLDWFHWYMRWQRFNAFHTVVLFRPVRHVTDDEAGGYVDGLLTRLLNKPSLHRAIIVEEPHNRSLVEHWTDDSTSASDNRPAANSDEDVREAILATLYGTRLSHTALARTAGRTLSSRLNPDWVPVLRKMEGSQLVHRKGNFRTLDQGAMKMVQSLSKTSTKESQHSSEEFFQLSRKREHLRGDEAWVEGQILSLVEKQGWFTIASLNDQVRLQMEAVFRSDNPPPRAIREQLERGPGDPPIVNLPSQSLLRRIVGKMVEEKRLAETTWFREVGRPSAVYSRPGLSAFDQEHRCGQCAFYIPLRRRCRLWWLLDRAFGFRDSRWTKEGEHPLSSFETYKMRNSWRVGHHSSACSRFIDKKKDHLRKDIPENCEVCDAPLRQSRFVICGTCKTRYASLKHGVRVFTAYEHEFERNYREIAGRDSASDITRLEEERQGSTSRMLEQIHYEEHHWSVDGQEQPKTLIIYPGDRMLVKGGMLYIFKRRNVEAVPLSGTTLINNDAIDDEQLRSLEEAGAVIRRIPGSKITSSQTQKPRFDISTMVEGAVTERPDLARSFALAMTESAIHATERIAVELQSEYDKGLASASIGEQRRLLARLEKSDARGFLTYEALIMKQYWRCFNLPLKFVFERFGPRKRSRFVRESVATASGRARGYSAVDAAINYLHQRRLFRCREVNMKLGLDYNPGEGFLHRRRWNSDGLGLLLDLIDPFKFADREKLLQAVSGSSISWHEFYSSTDRHGDRFYYPKPEAIGTLENVGEQADCMIVEYVGRNLPLMDAYQGMVSDLIQSLRDSTVPFTPFQY